MAVTINARGTSVPYFKIGKSGTTFYQGDSDPSGSYTINANDVWFDTSNQLLLMHIPILTPQFHFRIVEFAIISFRVMGIHDIHHPNKSQK